MNLKALNDKIEASGLKKIYIAKRLNLSLQGLLNKLSGKTDFTREEVTILCDVLNIIDLEEKEYIFFTKEVE